MSGIGLHTNLVLTQKQMLQLNLSLGVGGREVQQIYRTLNLHTISPHTSQFTHANRANMSVLSVI